MTVMERLANSIVVPVVVLDKVEDAVPTAKAMAAGGVDTMEITFRTACAPECIKAVADNCPDVLVGAGTIVNLDQCKLAIEMGAVARDVLESIHPHPTLSETVMESAELAYGSATHLGKPRKR